MNKYRFSVLFSFLLYISSGAFAQKGYNIQFKVNAFQGSKALIAYHFGDKQYILDTLERAANGTFTMKADTVLKGGIYLFVLPPRNNYFEFLVDPKDNQTFSLECDTLDFVKSMKVTGSKQNDIFFSDVRFISEKRKVADELQKKIKEAGNDSLAAKKHIAALKELDQEVSKARDKIMADNPKMMYAAILKASKEPEIPPAPLDRDGKPLDSMYNYHYFKAHFWDNIDLNDDRLLRTPILQGKINFFLDKMVSQSTDSLCKESELMIQKTKNNKEMFRYMVVTLLNKYANSKVMGHDGVYVCIGEKYYCSKQAYAWTDTAQADKICSRVGGLKYTVVGGPAPELQILDANDKWVSMYRDVKADYTIAYFWDYNCGHCKKVTPKIGKIAEAYGAKGANVKFYTVCINGTREEWKKKLPEYGLDKANIINTADPGRQTGFDKMYDILSTPRIFVLDKDKKIIAKYISAKQLDEILNHFLYKKDEPTVIFEDDAEHDDKEEKH